MKVSHRWLQTFFKKPLPSSEEIADLFTFHTFEVESIEKKANDDVLDIKVLPDRASYCLSHEGIARELSALVTQNEFIPRNPTELEGDNDISDVSVTIESKNYCSSYLAISVIGLSNKPSPEWLIRNLESVGQKSINFLVDLANFVMLDIGQPMHIFDAEKVVLPIVVKNAHKGQKITTLDNKEIELDQEDLIISDQTGDVLAIAGIKGGKRAETSNHTTHIIVEAANFDSDIIRKTSQRIDLKTDASKRFENSVSDKLPEIALRYFVSLLKSEDPEAVVSKICGISGATGSERRIEIKASFISSKLGKDITSDQIVNILNKASIPSRIEGGSVVVFVPHYRKDLNIAEDIVDEVGRLSGYENVDPKLPKIDTQIEVNKLRSIQNKTRNFLIERGYSELLTYSLKNKGELEIKNPLASDKCFYRDNLTDAMVDKLNQNIYYADLLGLDKVKLFEFGNVFRDGREYVSLSIGVAYKRAKKGERSNDEIKAIRDELFSHLGVDVSILCTIDDTGGIISKNQKGIGKTNEVDGILEVNFEELISNLELPPCDISLDDKENTDSFKQFSSYPFIVRDIAVFAPKDISQSDILDLITKNAGEFLIRYELFDVYEKKNKETGEVEKISYAFRLVFQSYDRTLTDEEINKVMASVSSSLSTKGLEVR